MVALTQPLATDIFLGKEATQDEIDAFWSELAFEVDEVLFEDDDTLEAYARVAFDELGWQWPF